MKTIEQVNVKDLSQWVRFSEADITDRQNTKGTQFSISITYIHLHAYIHRKTNKKSLNSNTKEKALDLVC